MTKDYLEFPEEISHLYIVEVLDNNGCRLEEMIINHKWRVVPKGNPDKPFKKVKIKNEILEE
jgi:hypothetical protein